MITDIYQVYFYLCGKHARNLIEENNNTIPYLLKMKGKSIKCFACKIAKTKEKIYKNIRRN